MPSKVEKYETFKEIQNEINRSIVAMLDDLTDGKLALFNKDKTVDCVAAVSGGCDSICLLYALANCRDPRLGKVTVAYVQHNLSPNAQEWAQFVEKKAGKYGLDFALAKVYVQGNGDGIEAEARQLRYNALANIAKKVNAKAIVTAHHEDDQLETFLIQWMRGAGPDGLSAMPIIKRGGIPIARPFLNLGRKALRKFATRRKLSWVEDESNQDTRYLRNYLRVNVLPLLDEVRPGFRQAAHRSIELLAECLDILKEVAREDLDGVTTVRNGFKLLEMSRLFRLSPQRQSRVLRLWLREQGLPSLARRRLVQLQEQLDKVDPSYSNLMRIDSRMVYCQGGFLLVRRLEPEKQDFELVFQWNGEGSVRVPELGGNLLFEKSSSGFSEKYLKSAPLKVTKRPFRLRTKLKTHPLRPSKEIKILCKENGIPPFERDNLPFVWREGKLIFVGGLGEEVREKLDLDQGDRYSIKWKKDSDLL